MKRGPQALASQPQQALRSQDVTGSANQCDPDIMWPGEFRGRLGLSASWFGQLQQQGKFRHLEHAAASQALGARVYHRKKVDAFFEDRPVLVASRKRA